MKIKTEDIQNLVETQNNWRGRECLNLIASENAQSPMVRSIESNDFMGRYAEGHPNTDSEDRRYYEGTRWIDEIERIAQEEIIELANCRQADVRPISGNAANTALAWAFSEAEIQSSSILLNRVGTSAITQLASWGGGYRKEVRFSLLEKTIRLISTIGLPPLMDIIWTQMPV